MTEKRCSNCSRLLFIEQNGVKVIKSNNIEYTVNGSIIIKCKCNTIINFDIMKNKQFLIKSTHDVYIDSFNNGELNMVNNYYLESVIFAENYKKAIEKYFSDFLYYEFNFENSQICDDGNYLYYCVLCDVENSEATKKDVELWKKEKLTLYSNNISLECNEITRINLL